MPGPIPMAVRQQILRQYEEDTPISTISQNFRVSRRTVHTLIQRYKAEGEQGLKPLYSNCGKKRLDGNDFVYRTVRCMKSWHSGWGAEKIHAEIARMRPGLKLPHIRTLYRWFEWNEQTVPRTKLPKAPRQWATQLHEGWQIDAKEEIKTADGSKQCWLNITDECSGTAIAPPVFPLQENL